MALLTASERKKALGKLSRQQAEGLLYDWKFWARPDQLPPEVAWRIWLLMAGRGFGKTRTGAEWVKDGVMSGRMKRVALVGRTVSDVRDVMIEGESGLMAICPPWFRPRYIPSIRRITFPNGAIATTYSGDEPDMLRGPQHDGAWADELAAWKRPEAWDNLLFGLRLGKDPRAVVTTTPRPTRIIKDLIHDQTCHVTRGTTYDNRVNLAEAFIQTIIKKYEGTRLGRQELNAEVLDDRAGALWKRAELDELRRRKAGPLMRIVVAVDPAVSFGEESDATGIVVAGIGEDHHGYVLDDVSVNGSPDEWAQATVKAYKDWNADKIVAEANQGGLMVEHTIRTVDQNVGIKLVHATKGKFTRAEPVAALYEQGKVHHVGMFPKLEDEMCEWTPGEKSPDRMDALVWAFTDLMLGAADDLMVFV